MIAVAAIQISIDGINELMKTHTGLGQTGESYLESPEYQLRSNSIQEKDYTVVNSFRKNLLIKTEPVTKALNGESGVGAGAILS